MLGPTISKFYGGLFLYGVLRKAWQMQDAKICVKTYTDDGSFRYDERALLIVDKLLCCFISGAYVSALWPLTLYQHLRIVEMNIRRLNPTDYGYNPPIHISDYMFS